MAAIVFTLTAPQVRALAAAGRREKLAGRFDMRTLAELRARGWITFSGRSSLAVSAVIVRAKGRAVLNLIRRLQLDKEVKQARKTKP